MRRARAIFLAMALGMVVGTSGCPRPEPSARDREAIRALIDEQREAWNRGDLEGFMQGYHRRDDIVFTSGGTIRRGWDETLAAYRKRYGDQGGMGQLEFRDIEIRGLGPDAAVVLGHFALTDTPEAGTGVFSLVFHRQGGRWAIVHDHSSADPKAERGEADAGP